MKILIGALKEKCCSKKELVKILKTASPRKSHESLRKRCERFLRKFEKLGLVKKRDNKYCWYLYVNHFKDREYYPAKLKHSRNMIPALREIAKITRGPRYSLSEEKEGYVSQEYMKLLVKGAENHLKAYPEIWGLLEDKRRINGEVKETRENFYANLTKKLRNEEEIKKEPIVEPSKESKYRSFVGSNIPSLICSHLLYGLPRHLNPDGEKIWFGGSLVAKGSHLFKPLEKFVKRETEDGFNIKAIKQIGKVERDAAKIRQEFELEIRKLIQRIESGEPLLGGCDTCPKVYFSAKT